MFENHIMNHNNIDSEQVKWKYFEFNKYFEFKEYFEFKKYFE